MSTYVVVGLQYGDEGKGKITDGIVLAIKRCGEILLEKGFVISPDDVNELKDHLRLEN